MIKRFIAVVLLSASLLFAAAVPVAAAESCGGTKTQFIACDSESGVGAINDLIRIAVVVLSTLIGVVATGGIAYAAIQYASARDNKAKVEESMTIIRNIVIGLLLYVFTVAIINWLVPGGVIG